PSRRRKNEIRADYVLPPPIWEGAALVTAVSTTNARSTEMFAAADVRAIDTCAGDISVRSRVRRRSVVTTLAPLATPPPAPRRCAAYQRYATWSRRRSDVKPSDVRAVMSS